MMKIFKKPVLFLALILIFILLNGCAATSKPYFKKMHFLAQNVYCTHFFRNRLNEKGVKIAKNIHSFYLIIPAKKLFISDSANFVPKAYDILDNIAALLRCCDIEDVKITGLIQKPISNERLEALAMERARRVQGYLWLQKINASIMYATGKVSPTTGDKKFADQDYITITFRKLY